MGFSFGGGGRCLSKWEEGEGRGGRTFPQCTGAPRTLAVSPCPWAAVSVCFQELAGVAWWRWACLQVRRGGAVCLLSGQTGGALNSPPASQSWFDSSAFCSNALWSRLDGHVLGTALQLTGGMASQTWVSLSRQSAVLINGVCCGPWMCGGWDSGPIC